MRRFNQSRLKIVHCWCRLYSRGMKRSGLFSMRFKHNSLTYNVRNDMSMPSLFWKYFNAPGNVMFVTTNIVTFTGVVAYHTYVSNSKESLLDEKILAVQNSLETDSSFNGGQSLWDYPNKEQELQIYEHQHSLLGKKKLVPENFYINKKNKNKELRQDNEMQTSPFKQHTKDDIKLEEPSKTVHFNSQLAKISIFNLVYSYYLYKNVLNTINNRKAVESDSDSLYKHFTIWNNESNLIRNQFSSSEIHEQKIDNIPINAFYKLWRTDFTESLETLGTIQNLKFPNWRIYPKNVQNFCEKLYNNDMTILSDFAEFYHELDDKKYKGIQNLLRLWLYDNITLLNDQKFNNSSSKILVDSEKYNLQKIKQKNEIFYNELINDSKNDNESFLKYSSIITDGHRNKRKKYFFPKLLINNESTHDQKAIQINVPTATLDTVLNVLDGFIEMKEIKGVEHHDSIIRIISMLKKDCILNRKNSITNNKTSSTTGNDVKVLLLPNDSEERLNIAYEIDQKLKLIGNYELLNHYEEQKKKCYELVSTNPKAIELLNTISHWNNE